MEESAIPPLLGLIGHEIAGNPTQFAIERVLGAANLEWRFLSFDVIPDRLSDAVRGLDALGFKGLAVAPSHAAEIFLLLDSHSPSSRVSQWVDVVARNSLGSLEGHNLIAQVLVDWFHSAVGSTPPVETSETVAAEPDPSGEVVEADGQSEETNFPGEVADGASGHKERSAIVLGNTGKSFAMARLLLAHGFSRIYFRDVSPPAEQTAFTKSNLRGEELPEASLLIRASVSDDDLQVAELSETQISKLSPHCAVVDLGTSAGTSPMLRFASGSGLRTLSLIDLMVMRASRAFQLWTGLEPDATMLREAFEEYLEI